MNTTGVLLTTELKLLDDAYLFWFMIADAGMLLIASCYLTWRMLARSNRRQGKRGSVLICREDIPAWSSSSRVFFNFAKVVIVLLCTFWTINLFYPSVRALGQPSGSASADSAATSARNEAFHARIEEKTNSLERRLSRVEGLPEVVASQQTTQKIMHEQLTNLQKSVQDLIELQRNLFVGILLAVVAAALQIFERWFSLRRSKIEERNGKADG